MSSYTNMRIVAEPKGKSEDDEVKTFDYTMDVQIGQRMVTISTAGVPNTIKKLASLKLQSTLAVSSNVSKISVASCIGSERIKAEELASGNENVNGKNIVDSDRTVRCFFESN